MVNEIVEAMMAINRFYQRLDARDYEGVAAAFVEGGIWHRQGKELVGRRMILDAMQGRSPTLVIHHLPTNIVLEPDASGGLKAIYYLTVFKFDNGQALAGPAPTAAPTMIAISEAELRWTDEGWKFGMLLTRAPTFEGRIEGQKG